MCHESGSERFQGCYLFLNASLTLQRSAVSRWAECYQPVPLPCFVVAQHNKALETRGSDVSPVGTCGDHVTWRMKTTSTIVSVGAHSLEIWFYLSLCFTMKLMLLHFFYEDIISCTSIYRLSSGSKMAE